MEYITLWKRIKKHWVLLLAFSLALLVLVLLGVYHLMRTPQATPIAHIAPSDSITTSSLAGKLETYKKELAEEEKKAYKRKVALDEIVSMDFSQMIDIGKSHKLTTFAKGAISTIDSSENKRSQVNEAITGEHTKVQAIKFLPSKKTIPPKNKKPPVADTQNLIEDGFYTIKVNTTMESAHKEGPVVGEGAFVKAAVHSDQKVKEGGTVCIRLLEGARFSGHLYPKNTLLYGRITSQERDRINISISQIKEFRVNLSVYDQDYSQGIAYQMIEAVSEIGRETREDALNEVLTSLPYGGVAGGIARLGKNVMRKTRRPNTLYLADGYELFIARAK